MTCPFAVGDRIHEGRYLPIARPDVNGTMVMRRVDGPIVPQWEMDASRPHATVTEITERGFCYRYDRPVIHGRAAWGQQITGGECYVEGFQFWQKVPADA